MVKFPFAYYINNSGYKVPLFFTWGPRKSPDFWGKWRPKLLVDLAKGGIHCAVLESNTS